MAPTNEENVPNYQHIPDDLAFSILSKLSIKSLKRFGCTQKSWAHLLQDPYFMRMYRYNFIANNHSDYYDTSILLQQTLPMSEGLHSYLYLLSSERFENRVKLDWPPPFQDDDEVIHISDHVVNGTLCLFQFWRVVLWNPATEEFKVIPPSPAESLPPEPDQYLMLQSFGFGYDHVRDDYKVIRHGRYFEDYSDYEDDEEDLPHNPPHDPLWEVYSLRHNSWKKLDVIMPSRFMSTQDVVHMNGVCHWLCHDNTWYQYGTHGELYLITFDLSNDTFFETTLPLYIRFSVDPRLISPLVVLNGYIAFISNYLDATTFNIYILGELGVNESWTKLFSVGPLPYIEHPIGAGKKGDIFFCKKDGELAWFDLRTQMIADIGLKGAPYHCQSILYKESLLPIGGINN